MDIHVGKTGKKAGRTIIRFSVESPLPDEAHVDHREPTTRLPYHHGKLRTRPLTDRELGRG